MFMNRSFYFKDQVYDWGRFQKTESQTRAKITPKLPLPRECYIALVPNESLRWEL